MGSPSCMLAQKLKLLKLDLLRSQREVALPIIGEVDRCEASGGTLEQDIVRRE